MLRGAINALGAPVLAWQTSPATYDAHELHLLVSRLAACVACPCMWSIAADLFSLLRELHDVAAAETAFVTPANLAHLSEAELRVLLRRLQTREAAHISCAGAAYYARRTRLSGRTALTPQRSQRISRRKSATRCTSASGC